MKTVVLVIHLEIPENDDINYAVVRGFGSSAVEWVSYHVLEGNAPIRINIDSDGYKEI